MKRFKKVFTENADNQIDEIIGTPRIPSAGADSSGIRRATGANNKAPNVGTQAKDSAVVSIQKKIEFAIKQKEVHNNAAAKHHERSRDHEDRGDDDAAERASEMADDQEDKARTLKYKIEDLKDELAKAKLAYNKKTGKNKQEESVDDISVGVKKKLPAGVKADPDMKGYAYNEKLRFKFKGKKTAKHIKANQFLEMTEAKADFFKAVEAEIKKYGPNDIDTPTYKKAIMLMKKGDMKGLKKLIYTSDTEPSEFLSYALAATDKAAFDKMYPRAKAGDYLRSIVIQHGESVEVNEDKESQIKSMQAKMDQIDDQTEALKDKIARLRDLRKTATVTDRIDDNIKAFKAQIEKLDKEHARYRGVIKHMRNEEINEEDWSQMGDRSKDWTRRQYQKAVAAGDKERAKDFIDTYGRGVTLKVGHGQDAQGKEIGKFGDKAFNKRIDNIKKTRESMDTLLDMLDETNLDEALSAKEKEKRLAMIKKAVEKLNRANLEKVKKMAMRDMKASGMFDDAMDEATAEDAFRDKIKDIKRQHAAGVWDGNVNKDGKPVIHKDGKPFIVEDTNLEEAKISFYGSEIKGIVDSKNRAMKYTAKAVEHKGKLGYKVTNQHGDFETIDLKTFAKRFG